MRPSLRVTGSCFALSGQHQVARIPVIFDVYVHACQPSPEAWIARREGFETDGARRPFRTGSR
jgi:hypothetical protein